MTHPVKPFKIAVPDAALANLHSKLAAAKFPAATEFNDDVETGAPLRDVQRLAAYWRDGFDWRAQESRLNAELPQFTTRVPVDGGFGDIDVHFIHKRSSHADSIPLLFCHGWPGSFFEVVKILPLLTEPRDGGPSFHVVAPSLPNFGFSEAVAKPGFGLAQYAECVHKIMLRLGYDQYVTQGGDWGSMITRTMGVRYPNHCAASHINMLQVRPSVWAALGFGLRWLVGWSSADDRRFLSRTLDYALKDAGYALIQGTKPSTPGFAVADSPVALLAWIYEKLIIWTDNYPWTDDEVLTWISIYQFSAAGPAASMRIYYEVSHTSRAELSAIHGYVPRVALGVSLFPKELSLPPRAWAPLAGPVALVAEHDRGGHFAAFECPDALVTDIKTMFGEGGGARAVFTRLAALGK